MKFYELTKEEEDLVKALQRDDYISASDLKERRGKLKTMALNTLNKNRNINIRLSDSDLLLLKRKAAEKGLPYQTLVASVLHQYVHEKVEIRM